MQRQTRHGLILTAVAFCTILLVLHRPAVDAAPQPRIVNPSWSLDFTFQTPAPVAIERDGNVVWYWYLPYKVTNHTNEDRMFIPEIIIYNDTGEIIAADHMIPPAVFAKVKEQLNNPLLKDSMEIVGRILKGDDFAKEGAAIWPAAEEDVDTFSIFIGGLHGETQTFTNPETGDTEVLRRTLMLEFAIPGNFRSPQRQPVKFIGQRDVMR